MERLGEFDNKVIIEQNNEPENKNVIWKDPAADEFKEYEDGAWIKSRKIGTPNLPSPIEVSDITALTAEQLDALNVGDKVVKVTGADKHLYVVTYKATTGGGICLSYFDAVNTETVSYDRTESGWAYNSTDKGAIPSA